MYNLLQNIVDAVLGVGVLDVSSVDSTVLFLSALFMMYFVYIALRSLIRFFINIRF